MIVDSVLDLYLLVHLLLRVAAGVVYVVVVEDLGVPGEVGLAIVRMGGLIMKKGVMGCLKDAVS